MNSAKISLILLSALFAFLLLFIWQYNLRPLLVNAKINTASHLLENGDCETALHITEQIYSAEKSLLLASYVRRSYIDLLRQCNKIIPTARVEFAQKGYDLLKESVQERPLYTRNWIFLGGFTNTLIDAAQKGVIQESQLSLEQLKEEAHTYFEQAQLLSPKRQEVYVEWIKTFLITQDYGGANQKAQECIDLNPQHDTCEWLKQTAEIYTQERQLIEIGVRADLRFNQQVKSLESLNQLLRAYIATENLPGAIQVYRRLIQFEPSNFQHHASLAFAHAGLRQYGQAKGEVSKVLKLSPDSKSQTEAFLATFPTNYQQLMLEYQQLVKNDPTDAEHHLSLAHAFREIGRHEAAREEAFKASEIDPDVKSIVKEFLVTLPPNYTQLVYNYSKLSQAEPDNFEHPLRLAMASTKVGNFELARQNLLKVQELNPKLVEAINELLSLLPNGARSTFFQKPIETDYEYFQFYLSLAQVFQNLGAFDEARQDAETALQVYPAGQNIVEEFLLNLP